MAATITRAAIYARVQPATVVDVLRSAGGLPPACAPLS